MLFRSTGNEIHHAFFPSVRFANDIADGGDDIIIFAFATHISTRNGERSEAMVDVIGDRDYGAHHGFVVELELTFATIGVGNEDFVGDVGPATGEGKASIRISGGNGDIGG